jgi:hypothetical protein
MKPSILRATSSSVKVLNNQSKKLQAAENQEHILRAIAGKRVAVKSQVNARARRQQENKETSDKRS